MTSSIAEVERAAAALSALRGKGLTVSAACGGIAVWPADRVTAQDLALLGSVRHHLLGLLEGEAAFRAIFNRGRPLP